MCQNEKKTKHPPEKPAPPRTAPSKICPATTMELKGKALAYLFFPQNRRDNDRWTCDECDAVISQKASGYSNLTHHINSRHKDAIKRRQSTARTQTSFASGGLSLPKKTQAAHAWLEAVILGLQPFSFVENTIMRKHFRHSPISVDSLMRYINKLTHIVERHIAALLPEKFGIVFDGWAGGDTHYVGVFATYPSAKPCGFDSVLLAFAPMGDEDSQNAYEHFEFLEFVLGVYDKSFKNVAALIGDNCNTNRAFSRRVGPVFVGCHSHRYNLALKDIMAGHVDTIESVRVLMKRLSYQIPAARLRRHTKLRAKQDCETRWSSTFQMMKRYIALRPAIAQLDLPEIDDLLPPSHHHNEVVHLCQKLEELESITKKLQNPSVTLWDARILFDGMCEKFGEIDSLPDRLGPRSAIVENSAFEAALVKIQSGREHHLTGTEKRSVQHLLKEPVSSSKVTTVQPRSTADEWLERGKQRRGQGESKYIDTRFVVATSNMCERLFSIGGAAMGTRRKGMLPSSFEEQLFLYVNAFLWGVKEVHEIVN